MKRYLRFIAIGISLLRYTAARIIYHTPYSGEKFECYDNKKKQRRLMRDRRRKYRASTAALRSELLLSIAPTLMQWQRYEEYLELSQ